MVTGDACYWTWASADSTGKRGCDCGIDGDSRENPVLNLLRKPSLIALLRFYISLGAECYWMLLVGSELGISDITDVDLRELAYYNRPEKVEIQTGSFVVDDTEILTVALRNSARKGSLF